MLFKKKSEYINNVNNPQPEPEASAPSPTPTVSAPKTPQTSAEWEALANRLLEKKREKEALLQQLTSEQQGLALLAQLDDPAAIARIQEIGEKEVKIRNEVTQLTDAWMDCNRKLTQAERFEAEAAAEAKRQRFESLLNQSLTLAEQSDAHLSNYAAVMIERQSILMEAQGLAASNEERGRVSQLLGRQGVSWQFGFYGIQRYVEASDWMFTRDFASLADFTRVRLQNWGINAPTPEPAVAPTTAATPKGLVN
jgi:hypothetical protein